MSIGQRLYFRMPFKGSVLINESTLCKGSNISEDGMYVFTGHTVASGIKVGVRFRLGGRELITMSEIKSCDDSVGMGLKFTGLSDADRDYIRGYIEENYANEPDPDIGQRKVLLIDDNNATRRIYRSKLVQDGYTVVEAQDGVEAIGRLQADCPDIVVLDLYMEKMDGYKVLEYIKGSAALKAIPVVIFSARGTQTEIDRGMLAGASGFLVKMKTSPVKLSESITSLLKSRYHIKKSA